MDHCVLKLFLLTSIAVVSRGTDDKGNKMCFDVGVWHVTIFDSICKPARCPKPFSEEWQRLKYLCCFLGSYFHCQQNSKGKIEVICTPPGSCPLGKYASIESLFQRRVLCQTCPFDEYQPTEKNFSAFVRSSCDKKRIKCEDFDAVPLATGNSSTDDTCMCDWVHGYRPVSKTDYHCRTFNSSHASTCRCKFHRCRKGERLHPKSFQCIDLIDADEDYYQLLREYTEQLGHRYDGKIEILKAVQGDFAFHKAMTSQSSCHLSTLQEWLVPPEVFPPVAGAGEGDTPPLPTSEGPGNTWLPVMIGVLCLVVLCSCALLAFFLRRGRGSKTRDHLIRISFASQKTADVVSKEVKNILPLLARRHGQLHLASSPSSRHLTLVIHPKQGRLMDLAQLFKDAFSPVGVKQAITGSPKSTGSEIQICVWRGRFQDADVKRACLSHIPPVNSATLSCDTGEISLKSSKIDDEVLKQVCIPSCKASLSNIFSRHLLELDSIRSGSIVFTFHLPNGSTTFDAYAIDERMKEFVEELVSHEAFRSLAKEIPMKVEFVCKAKLDKNVSVVYAENLTVQVGVSNKVYLCDNDPASHCDHTQAASVDAGAGDGDAGDAGDGDAALVTSADELQATVGEMLKFNTVRIHGNATGTSLGVKDHWVDKDRQPSDAFIKVRCRTSAMADSLHAKWTNVLPLLKQYHPGCQMRRCPKDACIVWRLRASGTTTTTTSRKLPDTATFLKDIFGMDTVKYLVLENPPRVEVVSPQQREEEEEVRQSTWQKISQFLKANSTKRKTVLFILAYAVIECSFFGFRTECYDFSFYVRLVLVSFVCQRISQRQ